VAWRLGVRETLPDSSSPGAIRAARRHAAAGLGRRFLASAIDWIFCGAVLAVVAAFVAYPMEAAARDDFGNVSNDVLWMAARGLLAAPVLLYFGCFLRTGHTLGMRALDFHVQAASTGKAPGLVRSAARACLAAVFAAAAYVAWFHLSTDPPAPEDPYKPYYWEPGHVTAVTAEWITVVAVLGKLWSWADQSGRSLWDLLFGLVFVERAEASDEERALSDWLARRRS
jgi:uncharacterized RDD family membrane protein YckC